MDTHFTVTPRFAVKMLEKALRLYTPSLSEKPMAEFLADKCDDLGFEDIDVNLAPHNLIFGELRENEKFNFMKKAEMAGKMSGYPFEEYDDTVKGFMEEFQIFFRDPRIFTYTPLIACRGCKPNA